jgi:hypothetical protein
MFVAYRLIDLILSSSIAAILSKLLLNGRPDLVTFSILPLNKGFATATSYEAPQIFPVARMGLIPSLAGPISHPRLRNASCKRHELDLYIHTTGRPVISGNGKRIAGCRCLVNTATLSENSSYLTPYFY